jgi:small neutral amino acid transporter SnatA (MarC family)
MYAGFLMLTAVGNMSQITKAKAVFRRVIIGFLIMFMAFLLVQQLLKNLKLSPQAQGIIGRIIDLN